MFTSAIVAMMYNRATFVRDSIYVDLPPGGGALRGLELTELLGGFRVRMGNMGEDRWELLGRLWGGKKMLLKLTRVRYTCNHEYSSMFFL